MNKKGVEMSMNVIIIAAIGLLILIILAVLVINSVNKTNSGMQSCNVMGGTCEVSCSAGHEQISNAAPCGTSKPVCCKILAIQ
jgi:hypothetical protein